MVRSRFELFSGLLIPVTLLVFAAPFIALLFYSSMTVDDFAKATLAFYIRQPSILSITWLYYTRSSGRWLTTILQCFVMSRADLTVFYGWLLLLIMLSNIAALSYFLVSFLRVSSGQALLAAGVFYAVWLTNVPTPIQGVFWLTVAFEYQLSLTAMLILAGLLCKPRHAAWSYMAIAALAIAIPGQHEIAGLFTFICLLGAVAAVRLQKSEARQWWLALGLTTVSLAVIMLSPGKVLQFAHGHKTPWDVAHILPYAKRAMEHGIDWAMNPAVLLYAFCSSFLLRSEDLADGREYIPPRWLALAGLGAMGALLVEFASAEMTSGYGVFPPRTVGWFQFVFSLLLVGVIVIGVPEISRVSLSPVSRAALSLFLVASLLGFANFRLAEKDLRGPARPYWKSSIARLRQRGDALQFGPLPARPALFEEPSLAARGATLLFCVAEFISEIIRDSDDSEAG
jgi:hypothetical protein